MAQWVTVLRPGYLGSLRDTKYQEWSARFGSRGWRLVWKIGPAFHDFLGACALYEDAYFEYLKNSDQERGQLIRESSDVYDDSSTNIHSGLNYFIQETKHTHVQDIAIRRALMRLGFWFEGSELIQIRDRLGEHPLSMALSPGRVPFHRPDLIETPELTGWWVQGSVEAFYQSNRFLQKLEI
ncbi:MAG TPA: hypothetical protein VJB70_01785 [Candidatus Paceibacterota bacterium]